MKGFLSYVRRSYNDGTLRLLAIIAIVFLVGVGVGAVISAKEGQDKMQFFMSSVENLPSAAGQNYKQAIINSFSTVFCTFVFLFLCRFLNRKIAAFLCGMAICYKGIVTGYTVAMLFRAYFLRGVIIAVFAVLPQYIFLLPALFLLSVAAVKESGKNRPEKRISAKKLLFILPVLMVAAFGVACADAVVAQKLIGVAIAKF